MAMIVRMAGIPVKELLDYVFSRAVDIDRGSGNGLPPILLVAADGEPSYGMARASGAAPISGRTFQPRPRVAPMVNTTAVVLEERDFILTGLSPGRRQKRLALLVVLALLAALTVVPVSNIQLARVDAVVPAYGTASSVNDSITAVLLFAQFSVLRSRALLAIASGYTFTALVVVAWLLTFPGLFALAGLLGAGLQTTTWLYILWHSGFLMFVIAMPC